MQMDLAKGKSMAIAIAKRMAGGGNDGRYFSTTKKGETHELRQELNHQSRDKKKSAVKKVIANMTVGKDVSMLFTDVVNCMQTADTQLKKLVYLYLINYAKSNPDLTILAVNTFVKDANDPNPLIRALSVRTMGCIRVDRIIEYLCEPLRRCLQDDDPYVRKTAAICVAKLFDINPDMVEEQGFLELLNELISDSNPTVVANAVAALTEISEGGTTFNITKSVLQKLLAALNECAEWGQVFVLDALSRYEPKDSREAEGIIERVTPRLQHANSAVVLSAIRVILKFLTHVNNKDTIRAISKKMAPPLVTLLSTEPEIQYVALRNINLIVQKRPNILTHEIKVFFCKYNDPIYVKMEKLDIIIRLVSERNIEQVLLEFKEYATEVDVDFVRRSVRAIGQCAIKLSKATERCINVLLELIQTKVNYIVQEAIVVIKDIFRKYPNKYESIIATLCENLDTLDEPEAKASMIWIIGEYAERIDNADELLETFLDCFHDETPLVQLQLLTSTVKLFLKRPNDAQEMVQRVLNMATEESDNPDLRDRGYVYWRLLSSNPDAAKAVVLAERPTIKDASFSIEPTLLDQLIGNIATLSSVYHKLPESFIAKSALAGLRVASDGEDEEDEEEDEEGEEYEKKSSSNAAPVDLLDMGGMDLGASPPPPAPASSSSSGALDIFGASSPRAAPVSSSSSSSYPVLIPEEKGKGFVIRGKLNRTNGQLVLDLFVENRSQGTPLSGFAIQFNKSTFGLVPAQQQMVFSPAIQQGASSPYALNMSVSQNFINASAAPAASVQVALKNLDSKDVIYFQIDYEVQVLFSENGQLEKSEFIAKWKSIDESKEVYSKMDQLATTDIDSISKRFENANVFYVAKRTVANNQQVAYYSLKTMNNVQVLMELTFAPGETGCQVCLKLDATSMGPLFQKALASLLN